MAVLQQSFFEGCDTSDRRVPDWGKAIFSPLAVCITPKTPEELAGFVKWVRVKREGAVCGVRGARKRCRCSSSGSCQTESAHDHRVLLLLPLPLPLLAVALQRAVWAWSCTF